MKKVMNKNKAIIIAMMALISTSFSNPLSAMDKKSDPPAVEMSFKSIQDSDDARFALRVRQCSE